MRLSKSTYGLVGRNLSHSFSRSYFAEKFRQMNIDAEYLNFELPEISGIRPLVETTPSIKGFNVTIPYKESIIPYLDHVDAAAQHIGAVNTVNILQRSSKKILIGYNTDFIGFKQSIEPLIQPHHTKALVLGTGGASKAVAAALMQMGVNVTNVSRTKGATNITYAEIDDKIMSTHLIIVNTTPLGMWPDVDSYPHIPYQFLTPRHLCYDLVYNPLETKFIINAKAHGAITMNGLAMLHGQADAAWQIWTDKQLINTK